MRRFPDVVTSHDAHKNVATFLCVRPTNYSFHTVDVKRSGLVGGIQDITQANIWINGGFFVFNRKIFDFIEEGEDLVERALQPPDRGEAGPRLPLRGLLGADGHAEGQAQPGSAPRGRAPTVAGLGAERPPTSSVERMLTLNFDVAAGAPTDACSPSAPTPTTSRSAAAARCCGWPPPTRTSRSTGSSSAASPARADEARASAESFLADVATQRIVTETFRDGFFPYDGGAVKEFFEGSRPRSSPDLILTHRRDDLHQDHRLVAELTWNTFRDHLILEYEVPKYDGDLGAPNFFVHLDDATCDRKISTLMTHFASQLDHRWFTEDLFRSLLRLRGMESNSPSGKAEAFYSHKAVW